MGVSLSWGSGRMTAFDAERPDQQQRRETTPQSSRSGGGNPERPNIDPVNPWLRLGNEARRLYHQHTTPYRRDKTRCTTWNHLEHLAFLDSPSARWVGDSDMGWGYTFWNTKNGTRNGPA